MDVKTLVWASGLFEGEGCITLTKDRRTPLVYPRLVLSMNDEDVVRRFHSAVGGFGNVVVWSHGKDGREMWRWSSARFEHVQAIIAMLWGGLGERRKARAREVLGQALACRGLLRHQPRGAECSEDGCTSPVLARTVCNMHYLRSRVPG